MAIWYDDDDFKKIDVKVKYQDKELRLKDNIENFKDLLDLFRRVTIGLGFEWGPTVTETEGDSVKASPAKEE